MVKRVNSIKKVKNLCVKSGKQNINVCNDFNIFIYAKETTERKYTRINSKYLLVGLEMMSFKIVV